MSIYAGIFSANQNPPELNARSFAGTILRRQPNGQAPLFGMTSMTGRSKAKATTHGYFSKTMEFSRVVTTAASAAGVATLTVASTQGIVVGQVLYNQATGENLRVTGVTSGTALAVTRGFGRMAAADVASGVTLVVVGTAYPEGSARPQARSIQPVYVANFTQIFRNAWALTDTARATYSEQGYSNIAESQRDCMTFHSVDIESTLFYGQAKMDTTGSQPLHSTQGIIDAVRQYAPNNMEALSPTDGLSYDDLVDILTPVFAYSTDLGDGKTRVAFCDATAMRVFQQIGRFFPDQVTCTQKETSFGMVFTEFRFFKGRIMLLEHSLFNGLQANNGLCVVVDVPAVKLAYMDGRDAKAETFGVGGTNQTSPYGADRGTQAGVDAQGGSITSEFALELINPQGCGVITGMTLAKKRLTYTHEVDAADLGGFGY